MEISSRNARELQVSQSIVNFDYICIFNLLSRRNNRADGVRDSGTFDKTVNNDETQLGLNFRQEFAGPSNYPAFVRKISERHERKMHRGTQRYLGSFASRSRSFLRRASIRGKISVPLNYFDRTWGKSDVDRTPFKNK